MPLEKPKKPTELVPRAFGGIKNNFSDDLQSTGFEPNMPQTYNGDNLNYHLDATGKELDYVEKVVDFINQAPVNHIPFVNENNQLDYVDASSLGGGSGFNLFDTKISDHILEGNEAKGWALQGTYVSGALYPDFYNKCLEEYSNGDESILNLEIVGGTNNNGIYSAQPYDYALIKGVPQLQNANTWEISTRYKHIDKKSNLGSVVIATTCIVDSVSQFGLLLVVDPDLAVSIYLSSDNATWNIASGKTGFAVEDGVTYNLKFGFTGSSYYLKYNTDDSENYTTAWSVASSTRVLVKKPIVLMNTLYNPDTGNSIGEMDLNKTKVVIDNEDWFNGANKVAKNANGHAFYDISAKKHFDNIYNQYGIADYYGVDEENERIFLPRNKYFYQLTDDVSKVNEMIEAGLPNITGTTSGGGSTGGDQGYYSGAFKYTGAAASKSHGANAGESANSTANFDASRSSGVYGNSDTVQPPSSLKLLYYCVGNTEVTQAITNVTEITTSENDTIPMYTGQYFDFNPNHPSWLKGGEQQNSAGIYIDCYNGLVEAVNGTNPKDLKVINQEDMVSGVVYDEYWILNQDNLTFRTPLTIATKSLSGGVVGNGMTLGLTDGTNEAGAYNGSASGLKMTTLGLGVDVGSNVGNGATLNDATVGIITDSTKSGVIAEQSTAQLYFKVANAVQNLELLDVGEVLEGLANVIPDNSSLISSYSLPSDNYIDMTLGASGTIYTAPANGWVWLQGSSSVADGSVAIQCDNYGMVNRSYAKFGISALVPVKKEQTYRLQYSGTLSDVSFRFIYAQGDQ